MKRDFLILTKEYGQQQNLIDRLSQGWEKDPELGIMKFEDYAIAFLVLYESEDEKPKPEAKLGEFDAVVDVKDASHGEVAGLVGQGYVVHALYQKNVILIKRK